MLGNTPQIPFILPNTSEAPTYDIPANEQALARYQDIDLWVQPDAGNVISPVPYLRIASRFGGYTAQANGSDVSLVSGLAENVELVSLPGGNDADQQPLHVPGYTFGGDYFVAMVVEFDADADMSNIQFLFAAGVAQTGTSLQCYNNNGSLQLKHGNENNVQSGQFVAGGTYLVLVTYDATASEAKAYVNSLNEVAWAAANAIDGPAGGDQELTIGGGWDAAKDSVQFMIDGTIRAFWAGKAPLGAPRYDTLRSAFLTRVAGLYADINLA